MKRATLIGICLAIAFMSCTKKDKSKNNVTTSSLRQLSSVEFTTPSNGSQVKMTIHYSNGLPDYINAPGGDKIVYTYAGRNPIEITFGDTSGRIYYHYDFTYNNAGQVDTRKLYDVLGLSGHIGLWVGYKYYYLNGWLKKSVLLDSNGNVPLIGPYIVYNYDSSNSLTSMVVYNADNTVNYSYTYTTNGVANNIRSVLPQYQVIGIWTETYNWDIWEDDSHLENQFMNSTCITSEKRVGLQTSQTNYSYTYDSEGRIITRDDHTANILTYTYQ